MIRPYESDNESKRLLHSLTSEYSKRSRIVLSSLNTGRNVFGQLRPYVIKKSLILSAAIPSLLASTIPLMSCV